MNIEKLNNDKDLKIYNLDYINTIGYECELHDDSFRK